MLHTRIVPVFETHLRMNTILWFYRLIVCTFVK